jgi:hypothetical protein
MQTRSDPDRVYEVKRPFTRGRTVWRPGQLVTVFGRWTASVEAEVSERLKRGELQRFEDPWRHLY